MGLTGFWKPCCLQNDRTPLKATDEEFKWFLCKYESEGRQVGRENDAERWLWTENVNLLGMAERVAMEAIRK